MAQIEMATKIFAPIQRGKMAQMQSVFWCAVTGYRFGFAAKAATGRRTPKKIAPIQTGKMAALQK